MSVKTHSSFEEAISASAWEYGPLVKRYIIWQEDDQWKSTSLAENEVDPVKDAWRVIRAGCQGGKAIFVERYAQNDDREIHVYFAVECPRLRNKYSLDIIRELLAQYDFSLQKELNEYPLLMKPELAEYYGPLLDSPRLLADGSVDIEKTYLYGPTGLMLHHGYSNGPV